MCLRWSTERFSAADIFTNLFVYEPDGLFTAPDAVLRCCQPSFQNSFIDGLSAATGEISEFFWRHPFLNITILNSRGLISGSFYNHFSRNRDVLNVMSRVAANVLFILNAFSAIEFGKFILLLTHAEGII